ncbi:helix-turn-helix transcriptional regulator [Maricaulis sp.]|uniref:helix-turn-helix transcriptional regulator n=1 Tax=Maricaulis sp. TaxID=1486257 RepID=UPI002619C2BE|nr:helix-turn-helix transcriptional regulator [Maricaulis sp.]
MEFSFQTFLALLSVQILIVAGYAVLRAGGRRETVLAGLLASSVALYTLAKFLAPTAGPVGLEWLLRAVAASETLPAALLTVFALASLIDQPPRWAYLVFVLPVVEALAKLVLLLGEGISGEQEFGFVLAGQAAIFFGSVFALALALRHASQYEQLFSDNRRAVTLLTVLPVAALNLLNLAWFALTALLPRAQAASLSQLLFGLLLCAMLVWIASQALIADRPTAKIRVAGEPPDPPPETPAQRKTARPGLSLETVSALIADEELFADPDLSVARLARHLATNRTRLSGLINDASGVNFSTYINRFRVERARRLLRDTDLSILQIAFECGFSSKSTFNRVFKSLTGKTPREERGG